MSILRNSQMPSSPQKCSVGREFSNLLEIKWPTAATSQKVLASPGIERYACPPGAKRHL